MDGWVMKGWVGDEWMVGDEGMNGWVGDDGMNGWVGDEGIWMRDK